MNEGQSVGMIERLREQLREQRAVSGPRTMPGMMRVVAAVLALAGLVALAGCAANALAPDEPAAADAPPPVTESERRIAADLVDVLSRVDGVAPASADGVSVTAQPDEPGFGRALETALREAGYDVAAPGAPGAPGRVLPAGYAVQRAAGAAAPTATYTVALADVQARRAWSLPAGGDAAEGWTPAGPLYVRGADVGALEAAAPTPAGTELAAAPDGGTPDASAGAVSTPTETRAAIPVVPASGPDTGAGPGAGADALDATGAPERIAIDPATGNPVYGGVTRGAFGGPALPTERNVMDLGGSNFASLFVDYADVVERILVFPNDSERLGPDNKSIVAEVAERFDPERDVFSIVGCSLGPTSLPNGNERLALGRANRVKEELVQVGVPSERIVDEGCWAGDSSERFPSRGVVLTLRRQV